MAITEDCYTRCRHCITSAKTVLEELQRGQVPNPAAVQARRTAADIAGETTYRLLRHAFITPIDREDLWALWASAERIWRTAEDTALVLYHSGCTLPYDCKGAIVAAADCCNETAAASETTKTASAYRAVRAAQTLCHTTLHNRFADAGTQRLCIGTLQTVAACEDWLSLFQYVILKNT